ncbi:MAG: DUF2520 domain-containing protein [Gammaproteobacteria bacterium]|nr:DUF2520 domain-containing protein [Gammaproteobacteria bacterium]
MKTLNIIGCGRVGRTLARLWHEANVFEIQDVLTRSFSSSHQAVEFIGQGNAIHAYDALGDAEVTLIATTDEAISLVAKKLVEAGKVRKEMIVFHTSGALSSRILKISEDKGAFVASVHPLMSFADLKLSMASFPGSYCCMEGNAFACAVLEGAFQKIGGQVFTISHEHKTLYHAASVLASNYVVTLMEAACQAYQRSGVDHCLAEKIVSSLVNNAVKNVTTLGASAALTGPLKRGEHSIVETHEQALRQWNEKAGCFYKAATQLTTELFGLPHSQFNVPPV